MDGLEYKAFIGKKVYVILKNHRVYTGIIKSIDKGMVFLIDRYECSILFNISEISSMQEEK